jgi:hypothetical protein
VTLHYTVCEDGRRGAALLFEGLDGEKIAQLPQLKELFPWGYFVTSVGVGSPGYRRYRPADTTPENTLVSSLLIAQDPDKAGADESVRFYLEGVAHTLNLRQRFNHCLSMFKAVGCAHCPSRGSACLSEGAGVPVSEIVQTEHEADELAEKLSKEMRVLGDYEYTFPSATRDGEFQSSIRPYNEHVFKYVESNAKKLSKRSSKAADTRKFKKTQCATCVVKSSCERASWCKGAYPHKDIVINVFNAELDAMIKASKLPEWQIWEMARSAGHTAKHSKWNIISTGVRIFNKMLTPSAHRAKVRIDEYHRLETYKDYARVFDLALTEDKAKGAVMDRELRAVWWMALNSFHVSSGHGWGSRHLIGCGITHHAVPVLWAKTRYLSSDRDLKTLEDAAAEIGNGQLRGIDKIEIR